MRASKALPALVLSALVVAGGCGGERGVISADSRNSASEVTASSVAVSSTTAESSASTTVVDTTVSSDGSSSSTTVEDAAGVVIDPEDVLGSLGADRKAELAKLAPVAVPTWIPKWGEGVEPLVGTAADPQRTLWVSWALSYPDNPLTVELDSGVLIELGRSERTSESRPLTGEVHSGVVRDYTLSTIECAAGEGGFSTQVLVWDEGPHRYTVDMVPLPGCAPGFTLGQALAFADSIVSCAYEQDRFVCKESPAR